MTQLMFTITPGFGEVLNAQLPYSQAVRLGDIVYISGQGGWDDEIRFPADLETEIVQAFDNVGRTLATVGATWADVVAIDSFHVPTVADEIGDDHTRVMAEQMRLRMDGQEPVWTEVGVAALGAVGMRVEIKVTAYLASDA